MSSTIDIQDSNLNPNSSPIPIPSQQQSSTSTSISPSTCSPSTTTMTTLQSSTFSPSKPTSSSIDNDSKSSPVTSHSRSTSFSQSGSTLSQRSRTRTPSISLTLLRAPPNTPIGPSHSINPFSNQTSNNQDSSSRLAFSFSSPKPSSSSTTTHHHQVDSQINLLPLTSIQHQQILLPFLDRPKEIYDLLFNNPKTTILSKRISSTLRSVSSVGDQDDFAKFKNLINTPRNDGIDENDEGLDDLELLSKLRELVEPKDKDLWARLNSCLGGDGLLEEYEWEMQGLPNYDQGHDYSFNDSAIDDEDDELAEETDVSNAATVASSSASSLSSADSSFDDHLHQLGTRKDDDRLGFDGSSCSMDQILSSQFNLEPFSFQLPLKDGDNDGGRSRLKSQDSDLSMDQRSSVSPKTVLTPLSSRDREFSPFRGGRRASRSTVQSDDGDRDQQEDEAQVEIKPLTELPSSFGHSLPKLVTSSEKQAQESSSALEEEDGAATSTSKPQDEDINIHQPSSDTLAHGFSSTHAHVRSRSLSSGSSAGSMKGLTLSKIMEEEDLGRKVGNVFSNTASEIRQKEVEKQKEKEKEEEVEHLSGPKRFAGLRISTTFTSPSSYAASPSSTSPGGNAASPSHRSLPRSVGKGSTSSLSRSHSLGSAQAQSRLNEPSALSKSQTQTQLPGGINFTKSRRLSGLFQGVDLPNPQSIQVNQSGSESEEGSPTPQQPKIKKGRTGSMSSGYGPSIPIKDSDDQLGEIVPSSKARRNSFVRSFASLSPNSPVSTSKVEDEPMRSSRGHSRSESEKGTSSQPIQTRQVLTPILHLDQVQEGKEASHQSFNVISHGILTPERSRRVTFSTMETAAGDLIHRESPPSISPLSSLKPLSPLRNANKGSALDSASSSSNTSTPLDLEEDRAVSEHSSEENENEHQLKARKKDISDRLDILEIENRLKLGLMKDGRTRHPSASRSSDVRKRSRSLNHSLLDMSQGGREEVGIRSGRLADASTSLGGEKKVSVEGERERGRGRRVTVGHNDAEKMKISSEEVEKFRREFGIRSNSGIKTPVEQIIFEEAFVDENVNTHMPPGMPFESTNYEDVDSCFCASEVPNCSTHGTFSPSKVRTRKRSSSSHLSQELKKADTDSSGDEKKFVGPSILESRRDSSRQLESEIEEERKQMEALTLGMSLNEFEKEMEMAQTQASSLPCQTLQYEEALEKEGNDIQIPPGLPFTPTTGSPPSQRSGPAPRRRSSLSSSFLPECGEDDQDMSRSESLNSRKGKETTGGPSIEKASEASSSLGLSGVPSQTLFSPALTSSYESKETKEAFMKAQVLKQGFELAMPSSRRSSSETQADIGGNNNQDQTKNFSPTALSRSPSLFSSRKPVHRQSPSEELRNRYRAPSDATDSSLGSGYSSQAYDFGMSSPHSPQSSAGIPSPHNRRKSFADVWTSPRLQMLTHKAAQAGPVGKATSDSTQAIEPEMKIQTSAFSGEKIMSTAQVPSSPSPKSLSTLVFPVPPKASRCAFISDRLSVDEDSPSKTSSDSPFEIKKKALDLITETIGDKNWLMIKKVLTEKERDEMDDRSLLEYVGKGFNLVDHGISNNQLGSSSSNDSALGDETLQVLAEESYEKRWTAFSKLCAILGVDRKDLLEAKKRAGPIQKLGVN